MIDKDIDDISYADIKSLRENKIDENDVLDYKVEMIDDEKLVRHVCAFANTKGGDIIFGIRESGTGGRPVEIPGLDRSDLNKERMEQVLLSNISPRLDVKIRAVEIPDTSRSVLLVRVPDSHLRPHQSGMSKKFYRRFQFESAEMTEQEVCDAYRGRFRSSDRVEQYLKKIAGRKKRVTPTDAIVINAITIPSNIERRLIETSDYRKFRWFRSVKMRPDTRYASSDSFLPSELEPCSHGLISRGYDPDEFRETRIHRNGCIEYIEHILSYKSDQNYFPSKPVAVRLIQLLQFTAKTLQHYNYLGDVRIIVSITCQDKNALLFGENYFFPEYAVKELDCKIEREHPLQYVETSHDRIASSIMDEVFNHYGVDKCDMFDDDGEIIKDCLYPHSFFG